MTSSRSIETLLSHIADNPGAMVRLARVLLAKGQVEQARDLCTQAVTIAPHSAEVYAVSAEVFSHSVPDWYFSMVRVHNRHRAYEDAMARVIRPGNTVIDIGTGTGLFAMMAARAGAARVVTCEKNTAVALAASEVVAKNGLSDRVHVIAKGAEDLEIGVDLKEPADVVICDALCNDMIGGGILPAMEQTIRRLARRGAPTIPAGGAIRIALAEDQRLDSRKMHIVEGFDLSPFNKLFFPRYEIPAGTDQLTLRSAPGDLFSFDFQSGGPFPEARTKVMLAASGGRVNGVVQWNDFCLDDEGQYENRPSVGASGLAVTFYPLMQAIESRPGDTLEVCGAHDRISLRIWAEAP